MKQSLRKIFGAVSAVFLIGLFVTAAPVRAASTDERIKALAAELESLKAEQRKVEQEQVLMKEDALAAKAKLPSFRYRPGSGLRIRGANKDWAFRVGLQMDFRWQFYPAGDEEASGDDFSPTQGSITIRRLRPHFWYYRGENLFWEGRLTLNVSADQNAGLQTAYLDAHFEQWNPYYPMVRMALRAGPSFFTIDANYGSMGGIVLERSVMTQGWVNTTSSQGTLGLNWRDVPLPGAPGTFRLSLVYMQESGGGSLDDSKTDTDDNKDLVLGLGVKPFSKSKNKWLKGMHVGLGTIIGSVGKKDQVTNIRARVNQRGNRVDFWRQSGRGFRQWIQPFYEHRVGIYRIRAMWVGQKFTRDYTGGDSQDGDSHNMATSNSWYIRQGVMLWSPKGFLTGRPNRPKSLRLGFGFERMDIDVGELDSAPVLDPITGDDTVDRHIADGRFGSTADDLNASGQRRMSMILRQINLTYFVRRNFKFFTQYEWYTFNKFNGVDEDRRKALGCFTTGDGDRSSSCTYGAWETGFQYRF